MNYYNEIDPMAAAWIRELIEANLIPNGHVDTRSIADVQPKDLDGYGQCHFFCGISGWPLALQLAGWPQDEPVFTGSCPCQPFSSAGTQSGVSDERHLWPEFMRLIRVRHPPVVFGEQVASSLVVGSVVRKARQEASGDPPVWLDGISADLEQEGYAVGAAVLGAHSAGAPHIRQRLYWVATDHAVERKAVFGGRKRFYIPESMEMDDQQQGVCVQEYTTWEDSYAQAAGGSGTGATSGSHQPEQFRQPKGEPSDCDLLSKQPQQNAFRRGSDKAEGKKSMAGLPLDRQKVSMAWIFCDEGGGDCGENEGVGRCEPVRMANSASARLSRSEDRGTARSPTEERRVLQPQRDRDSGRMDIAKIDGREGGPQLHGEHDGQESGGGRHVGELADADGREPGDRGVQPGWQHGQQPEDGRAGGFWSHYDIIPCRDGKARRVERKSLAMADGVSDLLDALRHAGASEEQIEAALETFPLARNQPGRVMLLRGFGNAICAPLAASFVWAFMET